CSARIFWASVRSTLGPAFTGASCESTAPNTGSTTSLAWQHGHVTFRFSPLRFPMRLFYAVPLKKEGRSIAAPRRGSNKRYSGFSRIFSAGEAGSGAQFRANDLGVG